MALGIFRSAAGLAKRVLSPFPDIELPDPDYSMSVGGEETDRFFSGSNGYYMLDADGSVWELDFSGYRVPSLPDDAVELLPRVTF